MAKYVHTKSGGMIVLRPTKSLVIDHSVVDIPPIIFQFRDGQFDTDGMEDEELAIELMDKWLAKNPRQPWIVKAPSDDELKKMTAVAKKIEKAKAKAVEEVMEKNEANEGLMKEKEDFDAFVKKTKKANLVKGMRDIGK